MDRILKCHLCYQNAPICIRQCKCFYCQNCYQKYRDQCICGGNGTFMDIRSDQAKGFLSQLSEEYNQTAQKVVAGLQGVITNGLKEIGQKMDMRMFYTNKYIKFLENRVSQLTNQLQQTHQENERYKAQFQQFQSGGSHQFQPANRSFEQGLRESFRSVQTPVHTPQPRTLETSLRRPYSGIGNSVGFQKRL